MFWHLVFICLSSYRKIYKEYFRKNTRKNITNGIEFSLIANYFMRCNQFPYVLFLSNTFFFILIRNLMQSTLVLSVIFCVFFVLNVNVMWKFVFATLLVFLIKYRKKNRYRQFSYIQIRINHFVSFIFHGNIIYTNLLLLEWGKKILEILWNLNYS